jgi:hypothetical protein
LTFLSKIGYINTQARQIKAKYRKTKLFCLFCQIITFFLEEKLTMNLTKITLIALSVGATLTSFPAIAGDSTQIQDSTQINTQVGTENMSEQGSRQNSVMENNRGNLSGTSQTSFQDSLQDGLRNSNVQRIIQRSEHRNLGEYTDGDTSEDTGE